MKVVTKKEFLKDKERYIGWIKEGAVFIYPTDTLYGIGCNAKKPGPVRAIREVKGRERGPFSVIAPSKEWIRENCRVVGRWLDRLPGAYTLIMKMKKRCVSTEVSRGSLGVRMPKNWFAGVVEEAGVPIVTTSVNRHGERPLVSLKKVPQDIKSVVDFAVDDGLISGRPSTLVVLTGKKAKIIKRQ
ncbi:TPA: Sua5/YciO/YrdC/YwlC family protein [Candidatus Woesearchaeota archaeon]|nr:Sua5/YciO/YrdC/YwlC family protein [Candidatus Woesearchaeota archaeon]